MFCDINGIRVRYVTEGSGEFVFILNGWGCTIETYMLIRNILKTRYTVVSFDFPGFGESEDPDYAWSMDDYTAFTICFIEQFHCKKLSIIGHSFGTRIMIRLANTKALKFTIDKMVFIDGAGILSANIESYLNEFYEFQREKKHLVSSGQKLKLQKLRKNADGDYAYLNETMCDCYINAVTDNVEDLLPGVRVPTLLIWGENDKDTPLEDGKLMEREIPDSGLVVLPDAGHFSFLDQPYIFTKVVESFFHI